MIKTSFGCTSSFFNPHHHRHLIFCSSLQLILLHKALNHSGTTRPSNEGPKSRTATNISPKDLPSSVVQPPICFSVPRMEFNVDEVTTLTTRKRPAAGEGGATPLDPAPLSKRLRDTGAKSEDVPAVGASMSAVTLPRKVRDAAGYAKSRQGKEKDNRNPGRKRRGTRNAEAPGEVAEGPTEPKEPRLPKRLCALLIGFCGSQYSGMQMLESFPSFPCFLFPASAKLLCNLLFSSYLILIFSAKSFP